MTLDLTRFKDWFSEERTRQGLSQMDVERASGISHVQICNYEKGADIRISNLAKLLGALGYEVKITLRRKSNENNN